MTTRHWIRRVPWVLIACVLGLMVAGLAGIHRADELTTADGRMRRQLVWIVLSLGAMLSVVTVPYRNLRGLSYLLFGANLLLLAVVLIAPARNGAHRWIPLGFIQFQPSEMARLTYIMAIAHYLMYRRNYRSLSGLVVPFLITLIPVGLIIREPDLGTSLLFLPVLFAMLFAAGARARHLVAIGVLGIAALPVLWTSMNAEQKSRIVTLFNQNDGNTTDRGDGYHLRQSRQVLALGGIWGSHITGMATDDLSAYHLPEARTDFVFCLVGEKWGLVGTLGVLGLYLVLFARGLMIAGSTNEPFGRLLAVGIVALLATQTFINTGMTVGLMPITGMTLPLVSYGGSSMLTTSIAVGLLINVAIRPGYEVVAKPFRFT